MSTLIGLAGELTFMAMLADVELSKFIVSIANAVVEANEVLNADPDAGLAITEFTIDVTMTGTIEAPVEIEPRYTLRRALNVPGAPMFQVVPRPRHVRPARLSQVLAPSPFEMALPAVQRRTSTVQIRAVISNVPNVAA